MPTPNRTTARAFQRYLSHQLLADSATLGWTGLLVRLLRLPRVVDSFLVLATPEPLITCNTKGSAEFRERDVGGDWITRKLEPGAIFVTHSKTPYEVHWTSLAGQEVEVIHIHLAVDVFRAALEETYPGKADTVEVTEFFGQDNALAPSLLHLRRHAHRAHPRPDPPSGRISPGSSPVIWSRNTPDAARDRAEVRGGLPIRQLHKVEDYVSARLAEEISVETLAGLVERSPFHFSRVFKQTTGLSPLQFVTRERITRAQQMMRAVTDAKQRPGFQTKRSLIEIAFEVGYTSPSAFAQVFRRVAGVTPTELRGAL